MKKNYLFIILFLLLTTGSGLIFGNEIEGVKLTRSGNGLLIDFKLPSFNFEKVTAGGEEFVNIISNSLGVSPDAGLPKLPLLSFNIVIAENSLPAFTVNDVSEENIDLNFKVYPAQIPWEKNRSLEERPFTINKDYYQTNGNINDPLVKISEPFDIGGSRGVMVTIYPFKYDPRNDRLTFVNSASIKIDLGGAPDIAYERSSYFNKYLQKIYLNYEDDYQFRTEDKSLNYLIITAPEYETGMQTFVNHKTSRGYSVSMFTTTTTGATTTAIKTFIQGKYDNVNTRPDFILLVGDINKIPAWTGSGTGTPLTDLKYVQLAGGDNFADAFIGRFSVTSAQELTNAITKSVYMENNIGAIPKKNVFMASTDNYSITEGTHNYVISNFFGPDGFTNLKLYTQTYSATTQQLINALNDNQRFAIYSGHGSTTSWADGPVLSQSQVRSLTNTIFPFVYSFACVTGQFDLGECFGETWLRTATGGCTFYGSSVNSYWTEDDILEKKLIHVMYDDDLTKVTPMMDQAKIYMVNHFGGMDGTMLRYIEMYNLMGDPSQPTVQQIPPDSTPPDAITDLMVSDTTSNSLTLTWTAPEDTTIGGVVTYDIRYSTSSINNDDDFRNAPQFLFGGNSDAQGTEKTYECTGLDFNTIYYFAVKAADIFGNYSQMSNVIAGRTWQAPEILVMPEGIAHMFNLNESYRDSVIITNCSNNLSTLDYEVTYDDNTFPTEKFRVFLQPILSADKKLESSEEKNTKNKGGQSIKGTGGPDNYGYTWKDTNEPGGPAYVWNDISVTGTRVTFSNGTLDDGYTNAIPMGIDFEFYGNVFQNIYISTNGFVSFNALTSAYVTNAAIPNSSDPDNIIAPFWDDLEGRTQGTVHYQKVGDNFIVQFTNWQKWTSSGGTGSFTFQIVMSPSGKIVLYYKTMAGTLNSATIGIENSDGSDGLLVAQDAAYIADNLAVKFEAEPEWFVPDAPSGTLYNDNSVAVVYEFLTTDVPTGHYSVDLNIESNCPERSIITVPITLTVTENGSILTTVDVNNGWNLVSVPVDAADMQKNILFPNSVSDAFEFNGAYVAADELVTGKGYWLKFDDNKKLAISGAVNTGNIPVTVGWNIIGPFDTDMVVDNITTDPENIIESPFFGYDGAYFESDTLFAGKGYWVKVNQSGQIIPNASGRYLPIKKSSEEKLISKGIMEIGFEAEDGVSGKIIKLCAGADFKATKGIDNSFGESLLPPPAPSGFDVRFIIPESEHEVSAYRDIRKIEENSAADITYYISYNLGDDSKGLELEFEVPQGTTVNIQDIAGGKIINKNFAPGKNVFANSATVSMTALKITVHCDGNAVAGLMIPDQYSLQQNYPNPFNPSTTIKYDLPFESSVKLVVYNLLGEKVIELVNTNQSAGYYEYNWDASYLSSGIYILTLDACSKNEKQENFRAIKKMVLMK